MTIRSLAAAEKEGKEPPVITSEDPDCERNVCSMDVSKLNRIMIKDLKPYTIHKDRILWVKTVTAATKRPAVNLIVRDDNNDMIMLELHNQIETDASLAQVQKAFPAALTIGIKNPLKKLTCNAFFAVRNDNP